MKRDYAFITILFFTLLISIFIVYFITTESNIYSSISKMMPGNKNSELITAYQIKDKILFHIDNLDYSKKENKLYIRGWAVIPGQDSGDFKIQLFFKSDNNGYIYSTENQMRRDVTEHFNDGSNYDNSGFKALIAAEEIINGEYKLGLILFNKEQRIIKIIEEKIILK